MFLYIIFTLETSFKPLLFKWGRGVKSVVGVTVNSKEENSEDFCPNHVQEFGLWTLTQAVNISLVLLTDGPCICCRRQRHRKSTISCGYILEFSKHQTGAKVTITGPGVDDKRPKVKKYCNTVPF
jgi:hypothetical protein